MIDKLKTQALALKKTAIKHKDKVILASAAAGTVFLAIYAGRETVARGRADIRKELSNGNVVVHINDKDYFTFDIMTDAEIKD